MSNMKKVVKTRDSRFNAAELYAENGSLPDSLTELCNRFFDEIFAHVRHYYSVAPRGTPINYESYICVFLDVTDGKCECFRLAVGDRMVYKQDILNEFSDIDSAFGKSFCMYKKIRKQSEFLFGLLYRKDRPRFKAEENTDEEYYPPCDGEGARNILKISYRFEYKAKNNVEPF